MENNTELFTLPGIGIVIAIAASNNDVYAVGFEGSNAKIWKNDVGTNLTNGNAHSFASDIDIQGNDVYVVGYEVIGNISVAKLWKNGIVSNLSDGNYNASALAISIDGKNVYIYGFETNGVTTSKVWKNGEVIWSKENFSLGDFKAVGEDFYLLNNTGHLAKILKNGVAENLSSAFNSAANALFITTN